MDPLISIVIPTIGRPTLRDTVRSIPAESDVQVIVVADGPDAHRAAHAHLARFRRLLTVEQTDRTPGQVGHPQRQYGMSFATGEWLAFIDDDDIYTPGAFPAFRQATRTAGPHIFRMLYPDRGEVLWASESLCRGNVGTPMFLTRNDPGRLGEWKPERTGDFDFINATCLRQGNRPEWHEEIVCHVRPKGVPDASLD